MKNLVAGLITLATLALAVPAGAATSASPQSTLRVALADAASHSSVALYGTLVGPGGTMNVTEQIGTTAVTQTYTTAALGAAHVIIPVRGTTAYVKFDTVVGVLGWLGNYATTLTRPGVWYHLSESDPRFSRINISAAHSVARVFAFGPSAFSRAVSSAASITVAGHRLRGLAVTTGTFSRAVGAVSGTLYVSAAKHPLPVRFLATVQNVTVSLNMSDWGKVPAARLPTHTTLLP